MPTRQCDNWLHTLAEYVEDTESPRQFWSWAGIFTLNAALQRRVWLPYGLDQLYPNLFIMIVAPPGRCRKGSPVSFAKKILGKASYPLFADSPTKRALTKQLHELASTQTFMYEGLPHSQCPISLISKELSSFLAVDPKSMIEVLTDLFDSHDEWEYRTSEKGTDKLYGLCVNCLFATTPSWMAGNLPEEAIGGGFTSRFVLVSGSEKYKHVPRPPEPDGAIYKRLLNDLMHIGSITGGFVWGPGAGAFFDKWYLSIEAKVKSTHDERLHGFLERMHILALKTAMGIHIAYSDELILEVTDLKAAIALLEQALVDAPRALSSQGRSFTAVDIDRILGQVKQLGTTSFGELMRFNYRNVTKSQLEEVLGALTAMGAIAWAYDADTKGKVTWKKSIV